MLLIVTSCLKEGIFKPERRLSKVYEMEVKQTTNYYNGRTEIRYDTLYKHLSQEWLWEDDYLTAITNYYYYQEYQSDPVSGISSVLNLTYKHKRLAKVSDADGQNYSLYSYEWFKLVPLTTIESYQNGKLYSKVEFTHEDKIIIKAVVNFYGDEEASDATKFALSTIMPNKKALDGVLARKGAKGDLVKTLTLDFIYVENNVTKVVMNDGDVTTTIEYTYDAKTNPFYGCFAMFGEGSFGSMSQNNIIVEKVTTGDGENTEAGTVTTPYEFKYDGEYPSSISRVDSAFDGANYRYDYTYTTFYEYLPMED